MLKDADGDKIRDVTANRDIDIGLILTIAVVFVTYLQECRAAQHEQKFMCKNNPSCKRTIHFKNERQKRRQKRRGRGKRGSGISPSTKKLTSLNLSLLRTLAKSKIKVLSGTLKENRMGSGRKTEAQGDR